MRAPERNTRLCRLADRPEDFRSLGIVPGSVAVWEDGLRTDGAPGSYEWWYFDAHLRDGSSLVIGFYTKNPITPDRPLEPLVGVQLNRPGADSLTFKCHAAPEQFSASRDVCDVCIALAHQQKNSPPVARTRWHRVPITKSTNAVSGTRCSPQDRDRPAMQHITPAPDNLSTPALTARSGGILRCSSFAPEPCSRYRTGTSPAGTIVSGLRGLRGRCRQQGRSVHSRPNCALRTIGRRSSRDRRCAARDRFRRR
jgi:hypothetical protein